MGMFNYVTPTKPIGCRQCGSEITHWQSKDLSLNGFYLDNKWQNIPLIEGVSGEIIGSCFKCHSYERYQVVDGMVVRDVKIKAIYRKNLKMTPGKIAAQVAHAVKNLKRTPADCNIVVLQVSDKKFNEMTKDRYCYVQKDKGLTEVEEGTPTAAAWIEEGDL